MSDPVTRDAAVEVGIFVHDLEAMTRFYAEALDCRTGAEFRVTGARVRGLLLGSSVVKLVSLDDPPSARNPVGTALGLRYLTVAVDDVVSAARRCVAAGAELVRPPGDFTVPGELAPRARTAIVHDPEGNRIELCQGSAWTPAHPETGDQP